MFYKNIKPIDYQEIQRFANIYGFPYDDSLIDAFYNINGGKPVGFSFMYDCGNDELIVSNIKRLLSFSTDDSDNIEEGFDAIGDNSGNIIPFALDDDDNYLCYYNIDNEESIKLFCVDNGEYYDIYSDKNEPYTPYSFFADLCC